MARVFLTDYGCPDCPALAQWELDCPGYEKQGKIVFCYPVCGNALLLSCSADCGWRLRVPENRRRDAHGTRPTWLNTFLADFEENDDEAGT